MRIFSLLLSGVIFLTLSACNNLEDASVSSRKTFIKIYESPYSIKATDLQIVGDEFVILGNMEVTEDSTATVIFKVNKYGKRTSEYYAFGEAVSKSFVHYSGGYIIAGQRIKTDPSSPLVENIDVASAKIIFLNESFGNPNVVTLADTTVSDNNPYLADYYGESITLSDAGNIILLGTYREAVAGQLQVPLKPFILSLQPSRALDWIRTYDLINRKYNNARSVHYYNGKIYWASSIDRVQDDLTFSYVCVPVVQNQSTFVNWSLLGESTEQLYKTNDIQPAKNPAFGFGVVGTYSATADGSGANIFFMRTDASGTVIPASIKYYDAILSADGTPLSGSESQIVDAGEALAATHDGGFILAGTYESNPQLGKGAKDIFLIRTDFQGNTIWVKTFAGSGNEEVVSVLETSDNGFVICGTSTIGTYATPMLIRIDKNGELKN